MIVNRAAIREALDKHKSQIATLEEMELHTLNCFGGHRKLVASTRHFCEFCRDYEPLCKQYLKKYEIVGGAEID